MISSSPPPLKQNDKIAIVAPSGRIFQEDITDLLQKIKNWNLKAVVGKNLYHDDYEGYHYAGKLNDRLADFQWALDDDEIKAIWCARGGYGAVQLIDELNFEKFLKNPKWIIGYSDITVFHNHLNNFNIQTIHGITVKKLNLEYNPLTFRTLKKAIFGERLEYELNSNQLNQIGKATGQLVGGNLSIIYSLIGSISEIKGENLILFIEDWNENWYHLDRMMMSLKRAGILNQLKGLIVGSFTKMDVIEENPEFENPFDPQSYQIIHKFIKNLNIPVCFEFPAGHTGDNRALIMGSEVCLTVTKEKSTIEFI